MQLGFPIRKSADRRPFAGFPQLIAGYHVLRRLSMPRHPPCTLSSLTTFTDHRPRRAGMSGRDVRSDSHTPPTGTVVLTEKVLDSLHLPRLAITRHIAAPADHSPIQVVNHATHKKTLRDKTIHLSKSSSQSLSLRGPRIALRRTRASQPNDTAADWSEFDHFEH
jgi:hypothetical protein